MVELTELEAELGPEYNGPAREELGRAVRDVWLYWAVNQPDKEKHPNWFLSWEQLEERDREVDRMIGGAIYLRAKEKIVKADQQRQAVVGRIQCAGRGGWQCEHC